MATAARKTPTRSPQRAPARRAGTDATTLLRADHKLVDTLFKQVESTRSAAKKKALVAQICLELSIHAQVEEEIFYPAVQAALKDGELVPEARVEHAMLKELIAQIKDAEPDGEIFDAKVKVLSEYVKHHVKEEQGEMFPKVRKSPRLDLADLGQRIAARKEELKASPELLQEAPQPASPALALL
jgi:hemerythrin superfamily protein